MAIDVYEYVYEDVYVYEVESRKWSALLYILSLVCIALHFVFEILTIETGGTAYIYNLLTLQL